MLTLKQKGYSDEIFVNSCTGSCHVDNFWCSQWQKCHTMTTYWQLPEQPVMKTSPKWHSYFQAVPYVYRTQSWSSQCLNMRMPGHQQAQCWLQSRTYNISLCTYLVVIISPDLDDSCFLLIFFKVPSQALGQSNDCPSACEGTLKNKGEICQKPNHTYSQQITNHEHNFWDVCFN